MTIAAAAPALLPTPLSVSLVRWRKATAPPAVVLYCAPFAGGSSRLFEAWALGAPQWLEVVAVELKVYESLMPVDLLS